MPNCFSPKRKTCLFFIYFFFFKWKPYKLERRAVSSSPPSAQFQPSLCAQPPCQLWQEPAERREAQAPPPVRQLWWQGAEHVPGHSNPPFWQPWGSCACPQANGTRGCLWPQNQPLLLPTATGWCKSWASVSAPSLAPTPDSATVLWNSGISVCPSPVYILLLFFAPGEAQVTQEATASNTRMPRTWPSTWKALQPQEGMCWASRWRSSQAPSGQQTRRCLLPLNLHALYPCLGCFVNGNGLFFPSVPVITALTNSCLLSFILC